MYLFAVLAIYIHVMQKSTSRGRRRLRAASVSFVAVTALALSACGKAAEIGTEQLIESQTGGNVDLDLNSDGGFSIDTEDGGMSIDENGNFVITDQNGETVTGNADGEAGDFRVQSDDGEFRIDSDGGIPPEWPAGVPTPEGISDATSSIQSNADELGITMSGSADPSFIEAYGSDLESAGFERTSNFESTGNVTRVYDDGQWTVSVNSFGEGAEAQVSVALFSNA